MGPVTSETLVVPPVTGEAAAALAGSRARVYRVLSRLYTRPVDGELLERLRPWGNLLRGLPPGAMPTTLKQGLRRLGAWLERAGSPPSAELLANLATEFTRLFRGLSRRHSPPPPYESVYRDGGLLYGPSTEEVSQHYRRFHLHGQSGEPPDHISLELDFMGLLCEREARAWQTGEGVKDWLKEEAAFLKEHLARWVPAFCRNISQADTTGFYRGLAEITGGWVSCDRRLIRGLLGRQAGATLAVSCRSGEAIRADLVLPGWGLRPSPPSPGLAASGPAGSGSRRP